MKQQTMSILFYLNKAKTNQKGVCPIYCRITFLKKRKQFSTGQFVIPKQWNSKIQMVSLKDPNNNFINSQFAFIAQKINKSFYNGVILAVKHRNFKNLSPNKIKSYCKKIT